MRVLVAVIFAMILQIISGFLGASDSEGLIIYLVGVILGFMIFDYSFKQKGDR